MCNDLSGQTLPKWQTIGFCQSRQTNFFKFARKSGMKPLYCKYGVDHLRWHLGRWVTADEWTGSFHTDLRLLSPVDAGLFLRPRALQCGFSTKASLAKAFESVLDSSVLAS
jgi:hypothetical protein